MRRLYAWIAGAAGGLAAYRLLRRDHGTAAQPPVEPGAETDPRAEELRAKLDEKEAESSAAGTRPDAPAESEPADVEARRRSVHEHGRAAIDEMQRGS